MAAKSETSKSKESKEKVVNVVNKGGGGGGGMIYCLGFIGALVYYFQQADGFWMFVTGFFKALVWPAILVYKLLESFI